MRSGVMLLAIPLLAVAPARAKAFEVSFDGYADARLIAPSNQTSWVQGGLGKFRFGPDRGNARLVEAVLQGNAALADDLNLIALGRAEPEDRSGIDALEAYLSYQPHRDGELSWSVKAGAFFPSLSLENDDLGW